MEAQNGIRKTHIAIFPCVRVGHFIPAAEFAKRLCVYHGFSVTVITTKWMYAAKQASYTCLLASSALDISFTELPDIAFHEENDHMKIETRISIFMQKAAPHVGNTLQSSSSPISALITDFFCTATFEVTAKLNIPTYVLFTCSASMLCVMLGFPKLLSEYAIPSKDGGDFSVDIPGVPLFSARDLPDPIHDMSDAAFQWTLHHWSRLPEAAGILRFNRFMLVNEHKVAIDLKMERDGFVRRGEVERVVRALMEGEEGIRARQKMRDLCERAKVALMEGGSSYKAIENIVVPQITSN
ncbi:hypothetical protein KI387_006382, partial [Taxus chinensis]